MVSRNRRRKKTKLAAVNVSTNPDAPLKKQIAGENASAIAPVQVEHRERPSKSSEEQEQMKAVLDVNTAIESLRQDVEKLKQKPKDRWDKFKILASLLVPTSITLVGFMVSNASKEAEVKSAQRVAEIQTESAESIARRQEQLKESEDRVSQAQLVQSFLTALSSPEPQTRKLAIEAILIALPKDGPRLVQIVADADPDASVKNLAASTLENVDLVHLIWSPNKSVSDFARNRFMSEKKIRTWDVMVLIDRLKRGGYIDYAIVNALTVLNRLEIPGNSAVVRLELEQFLAHVDADRTQIDKHNAEIASLLETLRQKLTNPKSPPTTQNE